MLKSSSPRHHSHVMPSSDDSTSGGKSELNDNPNPISAASSSSSELDPNAVRMTSRAKMKPRRIVRSSEPPSLRIRQSLTPPPTRSSGKLSDGWRRSGRMRHRGRSGMNRTERDPALLLEAMRGDATHGSWKREASKS